MTMYAPITLQLGSNEYDAEVTYYYQAAEEGNTIGSHDNASEPQPEEFEILTLSLFVNGKWSQLNEYECLIELLHEDIIEQIKEAREEF